MVDGQASFGTDVSITTPAMNCERAGSFMVSRFGSSRDVGGVGKLPLRSFRGLLSFGFGFTCVFRAFFAGETGDSGGAPALRFLVG